MDVLSDFHIDFSTKNGVFPCNFVQFNPKFDPFRPLNFLRKFTSSSQFSPKIEYRPSLVAKMEEDHRTGQLQNNKSKKTAGPLG